jgi:hypothetical protein
LWWLWRRWCRAADDKPASAAVRVGPPAMWAQATSWAWHWDRQHRDLMGDEMGAVLLECSGGPGAHLHGGLELCYGVWQVLEVLHHQHLHPFREVPLLVPLRYAVHWY